MIYLALILIGGIGASLIIYLWKREGKTHPSTPASSKPSINPFDLNEFQGKVIEKMADYVAQTLAAEIISKYGFNVEDISVLVRGRMTPVSEPLKPVEGNEVKDLKKPEEAEEGGESESGNEDLR